MKQAKWIQRAALLLAMFAAPTMAQLSGTFAIDNSAPTGAGTYNNFADAVNDLTTMGVNGAVTFLVIDTGTPYAGFVLDVVAGTSATNTITFQQATATRPVISGLAPGFDQTVRFGTGTVTTASAGTGPSFVIFDGFELTGSVDGAGFLALGCTDIIVRNCVAHTSGSGIGLTISDNCTIEDCEVYGTDHDTGIGGSDSYSGGIFAYYLSANNLIQRNQIHDCVDNGIFIGSSGSTTATPNNTVINNFVWNCGTQTSTTYAGGICCRRATNSIIANNSISMPAASTYAGVNLMGGSSTAPLLPAEYSNNLIQHNGMGKCINTEYANQAPAVSDNNLYDTVGGGPLGGIGTNVTTSTPYANLAAWIPQFGGEAASVEGPAGFISATDLHILPSSAAFDAGAPVAQVTDDIDQQARPLAGAPDIGADETPAMGVFANFTATPLSGSAPLMVAFTDNSFSSDPSGLQSWAWDFDNNGTVDSNLPNPSFTYTIPGTYSVSLTVTDLTNGSDTKVQTGYITVSQYQLLASSSGGGAGDLSMTPIPHLGVPNATTGYMFLSFNTALPAGQGPMFGITPDFNSFSILMSPATVGGILHWVYTPGLWPDLGFSLPAGAVPFAAGTEIDFVQVDLTAGLQIANVSNVARVIF